MKFIGIKLSPDLDPLVPTDRAIVQAAISSGGEFVYGGDEGEYPGHFEPGHPIRDEVDILLVGAARRLAREEGRQVENS
jgi:hypothetical protein